MEQLQGVHWVVLIVWGFTLIAVGAITFQMGKVSGIRWCRGKAQRLVEEALAGKRPW